MPVDPVLAPLLASLPPFPEVVDDWDELRRQELDNADLFAKAVAEPAPEGATKRSLTVPVADGDIQLDVYTPPGDGPHPVHLYLHGGGWVAGSINTRIIDIQMRERCLGAGCVVVAVEYRKAPEHRFPTGLQDCFAALQWVAAHADELGVRRDLLTVGGGSAGANLAAALCLKVRDEGGPAIAFQLLEVPSLDATLSSPSVEENATGYGLSKRDLPLILGHYLSSPDDALDPYVSPLLAPDLARLPEAYILAAEYDPLRDDGVRYATRLQEAGVVATCSVQAGHVHHSCAFTALMPSARAWRQETIDVLRRVHGQQAAR